MSNFKKKQKMGAWALLCGAVLLLFSCGKDGPKVPERVEVTGVTVRPSTAELSVGETVALTATVTPANASDGSVKWSSSAPGVATVSGTGVVTAVAAGTATITATAGSQSAACTVTVKDSAPAVVEVTSVTLSQTAAELTTGETLTLTATVHPADATDKTVTWTTSDGSVATVSETGVVTAVAAGTATITATAGGKSGSCTVTVKDGTPAVVEVTSVTLDKPAVTLKQGRTTKLTADVQPGNAADRTVTWTSSDPEVATVDADGLVKALKEGTTTVTATAGGKSATCAVTVSNTLSGRMEDSQDNQWNLPAGSPEGTRDERWNPGKGSGEGDPEGTQDEKWN